MRAAGDESDSDEDFTTFGDVAENNSNSNVISVWDPPKSSVCKKDSACKPKFLLKNGQSQQNKSKQTKSIEMHQVYEAFRVAAMNGNLKKIEEYIAKGVNVNEPLKAGGWTALMYACSGGYHRVVLNLLSHGANPNCHKEGFTALMAACASSKDNVDVVTCVKYLLNRGAEVNMCERHKMTPLMFASKSGRAKVTKLLLEHGAEVDAADNRGWTALCWAANHGHGEVVRILLEANSDPKHLGIGGESATELASENGYAKIAEVLSKLSETSVGDRSILNQLPNTEIPKTAKATKQNIKKYGELELFLAGLQLLDLLPIFQDNNIDFQTFLSLTDDDLIKIGVDRLGTRRAILDAIRAVHKKDWSNSSLPMLRSRKHISCPEAYAILGNITKHFNFIRSTTIYLHKQSRLNPQDLEMGKSDVSIRMLINQTTNSIHALTSLKDELISFNNYISQLEARVEHQPVGVISCLNDSKRGMKILPFTFFLFLCAAGFIFYFKPNFIKSLRVPAFSSYPIFTQFQNVVSQLISQKDNLI